MIDLQQYEEYWTNVPARVPSVRSVMPVTIDEEMGKIIQNLKPDDCPVLFWIVPSAEGSGTTIDDYREENICVVFVMARYDVQRSRSYEALKRTQPIIEDIKALLLDDVAAGCKLFGSLDLNSINTLPETEFYRSFAGWSIGFKVK